MTILLSVSIAVLAGLLMTRAFKPFKLPSVTAYLIAGVLIGPYFLGSLNIHGLGFVSEEAVSTLSLVSEVPCRAERFLSPHCAIWAGCVHGACAALRGVPVGKSL